MEKTDKSEQPQTGRKLSYLPYHCLLTGDKATTKLRIVYNASARENGPALNDCLPTGPPLTSDLLDILSDSDFIQSLSWLTLRKRFL